MSGLILNKSITKMIAGYPTVSDKYNVQGGILSGSTAAKFGDLLGYGSNAGYYTKPASFSAATDVAGVLLATNVKLSLSWPAPTGSVTTAVGDALNILVDGFVAMKLDSGATEAQIANGKQAALILATGLLTTADKVTTGIVLMPGYYFTGMFDTIADGDIAEVHVIATH